jgi:hypothetical protein
VEQDEAGGAVVTNEHKLDGTCWCHSLIETLPDGRKVEKHNTTLTGIRIHVAAS